MRSFASRLSQNLRPRNMRRIITITPSTLNSTLMNTTNRLSNANRNLSKISSLKSISSNQCRSLTTSDPDQFSRSHTFNTPMTKVCIELKLSSYNSPGSLRRVLNVFDRYDINLTRISSRPYIPLNEIKKGDNLTIEMLEETRGNGSVNGNGVHGNGDGLNGLNLNSSLLGVRAAGFMLDFVGSVNDDNVQQCLKELTSGFDLNGSSSSSNYQNPSLLPLSSIIERVSILPPEPVSWFPQSLSDLDYCVEEVIDGGEGGGLIDPSHPGFNDQDYRRRREEITIMGRSYSYKEYGSNLEDCDCNIQYTEDETKIWNVIYEKLQDTHKLYACQEYNNLFPEVARESGYGPNRIPQLADISRYLTSKTGFRLRPVTGLLSARNFLNCLAFRVFCSTQYLRHGGNPLYTPEPDVVHELMGHVPLLADPVFADFTQEVGLASLGASDEEIVRLASIYWFTIEFGLVREGPSSVKALGAGILSSFGEMEWSCDPSPSIDVRQAGGMIRDYPDLIKPNLIQFEAFKASSLPYPITTYQPSYFVGDSVTQIKDEIVKYCDTAINRQFHPIFNPESWTVVADRSVERMSRSATVDIQAQKQQEYFAMLKEGK